MKTKKEELTISAGPAQLFILGQLKKENQKYKKCIIVFTNTLSPPRGIGMILYYAVLQCFNRSAVKSVILNCFIA
jgi:hypothetical protein